MTLARDADAVGLPLIERRVNALSRQRQRPKVNPMINAVSTVIVPIDHQEEAKEFWTNRIGFPALLLFPWVDVSGV